MKLYLALLLSCLQLIAISQDKKGFEFSEYIEIVKEHHPIARQAELQTKLGEYQVLKSKGLADPKLLSELKQKQYDAQQYYSLLDIGLKVPTWYGVSFQAGYEQNDGSQLNPENKVPDDGLYYAGVNLPIGKGLFMDSRRAALRKAELYVNITEAQQKEMLNELILESGSAYWEWFKTYNNVLVFEDAFELATERYQAVKQGSTLGDRPQIDTLEAGIQLQTRRVQLRQALLEYNNAKAMLSIYLWQDGRIPLELDEQIIPGILNPSSFNESLMLNSDSLLLGHPEYVQALMKLDALEIDKRLNKENLKPQFDIEYNALSNSDFNSDEFSNFNNYAWGFKFSMPLFLRKERGELKMTNVKIDQTQWQLQQKKAQLNYKVKVSINELRTAFDLISIQQQTVKDYSNLLKGERSLFEMGESSLFMVNSREMSFIQSQLKLNELINKQYASELKVAYALGILYNFEL